MKNRSSGMTLIELMTALSILGVLVVIAVPSFRQFTVNNRVTAATNDLVTALNLARNEAIRRSSNVVLCPSTNQTSCSGSTTWADGWIVFVDRNSNGTVDADELVQAWPAVGNSITLAGKNAASAAISQVAYNAMGMGQLPGGTSRVRFQIVPPSCTGTRAVQTDVLLTGMIQTTKVACP